ncbi:MAG: plastocyanin/azurin family copper-binding protein, partial [Pseudomonadota bacterium]|nr:plastocyanin/azurin family copper-binding protein [Pseudomonadota bacterium]
KGHNVEFIIGPDAVELPKKSRINQEFTYTFEKPGVYFYQCTPHKSMGMIAVIIVGDDLTNLDQVKSVRVFGKSKRKLEEILSLI